MDWLAFIGSVLGGLISGLFTFFGVFLTLKHNDKKKKLERIEKANADKPRLEIISFKDFKATSRIKNTHSDCNVLVLEILDFKDIDGRANFFYNDETLDCKNLIFVEYELVNRGLTEIKNLCATSNLPRFVALVEYERREKYIVEHFLNYDVWSNKTYIKPNGTLTLRVYYANNQIPITLLRYPEIILWLEDVNGFIWSQALNAPSNKIEISKMNSINNLRKAIDTKAAIDCFRHPELW